MKTHRGREETREAQREWSLGWREFGVRLAFGWRERAGKKAKTGAREACCIDTYTYLKFIRTYYIHVLSVCICIHYISSGTLGTNLITINNCGSWDGFFWVGSLAP
jgi:hypothetical protein